MRDAAEAPFVLLVTGPAGAGKTSAAASWATARPRPAAQFSLDDVRDFLKSGYANPEDGWNEETQRQYDLARELSATLAARYVEVGITCAVDDAIFPEWPAADYAGWRDALAGVEHAVVVLLPRLDVVLERNERQPRVGRRRLRRETVEVIYELMLPWREAGVPVIDNSDLSIAETVAEIDRAVALAGVADG